MNTDLYRKKVVELGKIKKEINGVEEFFAADRKLLNGKKKTLQDSYNGLMKPFLVSKKEVESEIEEWVLKTWAKEKKLEEETGRIIPSAVVDIPNFSILEKKVIGEVDIEQVPLEYLMVNEAKIKEKMKKEESLEVAGVTFKSALVLTNTNQGGEK